MSGWLYLIRNRDLYKIGITKNFKRRMRQLKPDQIIAKMYTRNYSNLERELHSRYKKFRIPQTEYFRLEEHHLKELKQRINQFDYSWNNIIEILTKVLSINIILYLILFIFFYLNTNDIAIMINMSVLWMQRILYLSAFISLFVHSGKYLSSLSELKYRSSKFIIFIILAYIFRIIHILF